MSQPSSGRPLPAYVYRRRRLAVFGGLGLVLVLILLIWQPWAGSSSNNSTGAPAVISASTGAAIPAPETSAAAAPACTKSQVKVTAYTDAESYAATSNPQISFGLENTGSSACTLNVGTAQQVFTISSGSEIYWVSTDCKTESSDTPMVLQPKSPVKSEPIQWNRERSNPGTCNLTTRDKVPAGTYDLSVAVDGIQSASPTSFVLN